MTTIGDTATMGHRDTLIAAWTEIEDEGHADAIERFFADDYVRHSSDGTYTRDEFRDVLKALHDGFPDMKFSFADSVEDGDRVAYRWESVGTHLGTYMGVPPTHKRITATGITISRFNEEGKIVEDWASWNKVSVLHSLGIIPIS